ncbi:hypothetical protein GTW46_04365, partial [Streptomyces sp. SID6013]|nr:hypothetical protein [Streptomyces sp. SID6013]
MDRPRVRRHHHPDGPRPPEGRGGQRPDGAPGTVGASSRRRWNVQPVRRLRTRPSRPKRGPGGGSPPGTGQGRGGGGENKPRSPAYACPVNDTFAPATGIGSLPGHDAREAAKTATG